MTDAASGTAAGGGLIALLTSKIAKGVYVLGVLAAGSGYWATLGFPTPVMQHTIPVILDNFGKVRIDPIGADLRTALNKINELKIDLTTANGRNQTLEVQIAGLNKITNRLQRLTDRMLEARALENTASQSPSTAIPTAAPPSATTGSR